MAASKDVTVSVPADTPVNWAFVTVALEAVRFVAAMDPDKLTFEAVMVVALNCVVVTVEKVPLVANNTPDVIPPDTFTLLAETPVKTALPTDALVASTLEAVTLDAATFDAVIVVLAKFVTVPVVIKAFVAVTLVAITFWALILVPTLTLPTEMFVTLAFDAVNPVACKLAMVAAPAATFAVVTVVAAREPVVRPVESTIVLADALVNWS